MFFLHLLFECFPKLDNIQGWNLMCIEFIRIIFYINISNELVGLIILLQQIGFSNPINKMVNI